MKPTPFLFLLTYFATTVVAYPMADNQAINEAFEVRPVWPVLSKGTTSDEKLGKRETVCPSKIVDCVL